MKGRSREVSGVASLAIFRIHSGTRMRWASPISAPLELGAPAGLLEGMSPAVCGSTTTVRLSSEHVRGPGRTPGHRMVMRVAAFGAGSRGWGTRFGEFDVGAWWHLA